jgi:hypothetical protein
MAWNDLDAAVVGGELTDGATIDADDADTRRACEMTASSVSSIDEVIDFGVMYELYELSDVLLSDGASGASSEARPRLVKRRGLEVLPTWWGRRASTKVRRWRGSGEVEERRYDLDTSEPMPPARGAAAPARSRAGGTWMYWCGSQEVLESGLGLSLVGEWVGVVERHDNRYWGGRGSATERVDGRRDGPWSSVSRGRGEAAAVAAEETVCGVPLVE